MEHKLIEKLESECVRFSSSNQVNYRYRMATMALDVARSAGSLFSLTDYIETTVAVRAFVTEHFEDLEKPKQNDVVETLGVVARYVYLDSTRKNSLEAIRHIESVLNSVGKLEIRKKGTKENLMEPCDS